MKAADSLKRNQNASRRALVFACTFALSALAHGGILLGIMKVSSSPRVAGTSLIDVELFEAKASSRGGSSLPARAHSRAKAIHALPEKATDLPAYPSSQMPSSTANAADPGDADAIDSRARGYLDGILSEIKSRRIYPAESKRRGEEGLVEVGLTITKDGRIENIELHRSSSFARLDEAALKAVRELPPQGRIPDEWSKNSISVIVPFDYRLR